jgi:hypothetical protein
MYLPDALQSCIFVVIPKEYEKLYNILCLALVSCNNSNSQSEEQNTSGVTTFWPYAMQRKAVGR